MGLKMNGAIITSLLAVQVILLVSFASSLCITSASSDTKINVDVESYINLNVTPDKLELYASPVSSGSSLVKGEVVGTVSTNNITGYALTMSSATTDTALNHVVTSGVKLPSTASVSPGALASNTWGYNIGSSASTSTFKLIQPSTTPDLISSNSEPVTNDPTILTYGVYVDATAAAGTYKNTMLFTAVTNYVPDPAIDRVAPQWGVAGDTITVHGADLNTAHQVLVGGVSCASVTVVSNTELRCVLPDLSANVNLGDDVSITVKVQTGDVSLENALIYDTLAGVYRAEMLAIENLVADIVDTAGARIGTALNDVTAENILGISYGEGWYKITAAELLAIDPSLRTFHADYIVRYDIPSAGAVMSIPGDIVDGQIIHSYNYFGDGLDLAGLLSAVTVNSVKTATQWGEFDVVGGAGYDANGGFVLGTDYGTLMVDTSKPIGERYTIGFTIKGEVPQAALAEGFPRTVVAISPASSNYLSWVGIHGQYLHVYSYFNGSAKANISSETEMAGFASIDLTKICDTSVNDCSVPAAAVYHNYDNQYMNIYISAERKIGTGTTYTNVYINGELVKTFDSGNAVTGYGTLTLGDLRAGRGLKYIGSVYDFAFYSAVLDHSSILQNYEFSKSQLGI